MRSDARVALREASAADALEIGAMTVAAWRGAYAGLMNAGHLARLDDARLASAWLAALARDPRVLVAELAGEPIGYARWGESPDAGEPTDGCELSELFLHPRAWRRGAGSLLLAEAVARMRAAGFRGATLWVLHGNARARAFYEARGWRADGAEEKHDRFRSGALVHVVRYRRRG